MNSYKCSDGFYIKKSIIDRNVRMAKAKKLSQQRDEIGYNVCEKCHLNTDIPIDCSHIISVDECQKQGKSELAWDLENFQIFGRKCHNLHDKLNLKFTT